MKSVAIDASNGVSSTLFELFEFDPKKKITGFSLIDILKENKPTKAFRDLEKFEEYLEFLKKQKAEKVKE